MSALGHKRKSSSALPSSALPLKADIRRHDRYVRFWPIAEVAVAAYSINSLVPRDGRESLWKAPRLRDAAFVGRLLAKLFLVTSTVPGFFVVHKTEYAHEFVEAKIASLSFSFAVTVFRVPVSQENIPVLRREVGFANRTSEPRSGGVCATFRCGMGSRPVIKGLLAVQRNKAPLPSIC